MRPLSRLGLINLALVSLYFVPIWGHDALRAAGETARSAASRIPL